jgi:hypothetical protein
MYYCVYDINSGTIQQWLNSSINPNIPMPNLEVTQQEFENQNLYEYVINGTTLSLTPPTTYYIDEYGIKYSVQLQSTYQPLQCNFNDLILYENNQWVVATSLQQAVYNTKSKNKNLKKIFLLHTKLATKSTSILDKLSSFSFFGSITRPNLDDKFSTVIFTICGQQPNNSSISFN